MIHLGIQNTSETKRLIRKNKLVDLAERVCRAEGVQGRAELSLLLCDDPFIQELNRQYRGKDAPTDVLSFQQAPMPYCTVRILGDIVISLETVARFCKGDRNAMREEVRLLFCHGLLHLLGYDHGGKSDRQQMLEKQAEYLDVKVEQAWHS